MQTDSLQNCPQCGDLIQDTAKRIIKDSCGHEKCRVCLLLDVEGCRKCLEIENNQRKNSENILPFPTENQHTTVITYNNNNSVRSDALQTNLTGREKLEAKTENDFVSENEDKLICDSGGGKILRKKIKTVSNKRNYRKLSIPNHITIEEDPFMFKCNICNSKFKTRSHVKYHEFCLGDKKPFSCDTCAKTFILKSQLHIHQLSHSGKRPHVCQICDKSFRESGKLKRHMILHSDDKPHVCDECGKQFKTASSLKLHAIRHTGVKPFSCKYCKMKFNDTSNLKKHIISHSDERTHMCEHCGKKFKQKLALKVHGRSHLHRRDFICKTCGKAFVNNKDLKRHELVHLDSTLYSCGLCSVSFRRKDNLKRHIRNAHPNEEAQIIKKNLASPQKTDKIVDNPNAINVITASPIAKKTENLRSKIVSVPRACINGPLKLAFKTSAFRRNYNINWDCTVDSDTKGESSVVNSNKTSNSNIEDRQKSPPKEINQTKRNSPPRIFPSIYSTPNLSVDEFYANTPHVIKNIKFKIPENYASRDEVLFKTIMPIIHKDDEEPREEEETSKIVPAVGTSVIVNSTTQKNMHWRRRMSQNIASEKT